MRNVRTFMILIRVSVAGLFILIIAAATRLRVLDPGSLWKADPYAILAVAGAMMGLVLIMLIYTILNLLLAQRRQEPQVGHRGRQINYDDPDEVARVIRERRLD